MYIGIGSLAFDDYISKISCIKPIYIYNAVYILFYGYFCMALHAFKTKVIVVLASIVLPYKL